MQKSVKISSNNLNYYGLYYFQPGSIYITVIVFWSVYCLERLILSLLLFRRNRSRLNSASLNFFVFHKKTFRPISKWRPLQNHNNSAFYSPISVKLDVVIMQKYKNILNVMEKKRIVSYAYLFDQRKFLIQVQILFVNASLYLYCNY